ncbi:MAG TPA: hypothetical protein VNA67_01235 [Pseudonocardiaceae bacterium]|nr:hypothetical protein [Pseudonocardiaceae bacterium]
MIIYPTALVWPLALFALIVLAGLVVLTWHRQLLSTPRLALGQRRRCRGPDLQLLVRERPENRLPTPGVSGHAVPHDDGRCPLRGAPTVGKQREEAKGHGCQWCAAQHDLTLPPSG